MRSMKSIQKETPAHEQENINEFFQKTQRYVNKFKSFANIVACRPVARPRPVINIGTMFSVQSVPRCYKQDNSRIQIVSV
jgi:hypothetical protein